MERKKLKILRVLHGVTQQQAADKIGVSRITYATIEQGTRLGTITFWTKLQEAFEIPDAEMWELIKTDAK